MNDTVVFSIGRFNPPTKGHFFLFDRMKKEAKEREADLVVFVTDSHDIKRNPLYISDKLYYLKNMFKGLEFQRIANAHYAMLWLADNGYKNVYMIIGNDRKESFIDLIKYGKQNGTYDFRNSKVIGLERNDDAEDVSGLSATKARDAASNGDIQKFINMIPDTVSLGTKRKLYRDVREGMGLGK